MELHSYAKRRTVRKWTIEQKRKLVETRITYDAWFTSKPSSIVPWKNILVVANLDDFNIFFVRKQWGSMLARYRQYKQTHLDNNTASKDIDEELIKRITQEWEFFEPIHRFMTHKTTKLHSYALTQYTDADNIDQQDMPQELEQNTITTAEQEHRNQSNKTTLKLLNETVKLPKDCVKENIPNNTTIVMQTNNITQDHDIQSFSSDMSNDFNVMAETTRIVHGSKQYQSPEFEDENMYCVRNTDHDFYSKRSSLADKTSITKDDLQEKQSNYFADASEESLSSITMVANLLQIINGANTGKHLNGEITPTNQFPPFEIKAENTNYCEISELKEEMPDQEFNDDKPSTSTQTQNMTNPSGTSSKPRLSERDKYYRHKRHFNRRSEKRFDTFLILLAQFVKNMYPGINVDHVERTITALASNVGRTFSSDSEDDSQSEDSDNNIPKTSNSKK